MKININFDRLGDGMAQPQAVANANLKDTVAADSIQAASSQTIENLSRKKALIDAAIISQLAQSFFQKAILISSRLKSIASEAQVSGKMRAGELTEALTGVKSSLNEMQEEFVSPIAYASQNHTGPGLEIPQINDDFNLLKEFANDLSSGLKPDLKKIDRIKSSLTNKASAADNSFDQLINELSVSGSVLHRKIQVDQQYPELARDTVNQIVKYPHAALKSQGNINYDAVKNLL